MSRFDDLLKLLGTGKWNSLVVVAVCYWIPQITIHSIGAAFMTPDQKYSCWVPPETDPPVGNETRWQCSYNVTAPNNDIAEVRDCTKWEYDNSTYTNTLTSEFDLVCGRSFLKASFKSVYFFGGFFGALLNGWLSDRFGRKTMLSVGTVSFSILANSMSWIYNIHLLLVFRFFMGLLHPTSIHAGYILSMEVTEPRFRSAVGILLFLPWSLCVVALGGYGYLLRDWRWFTFTLSLPCLLFLPLLWFIDESPRWLIVRGRFDDALRVLEKAARWNKAQLPPKEELFAMMEDIKKEGRAKGEGGEDAPSLLKSLMKVGEEVIVLIRTRRMRIITLSFYGQFLVLGMVYFGLSIGGDKVGIDPFMYMAVSGIMELPGSTLTIPLVEKVGRRLSGTCSFAATAGSLIALGFIPSGLNWLVFAMAMLGKLFISAAYQVVYLYSVELFPTEVRVRGLGTCTMLAKVGAMLAPILLDALGAIKSWVPLVTFGVASLLAGIATLWLPESRTAPFIETVADLEAQYSKQETRETPQELEMQAEEKEKEENSS